MVSGKYLTVKRYRVYPDINQKELVDKTLGCCRFVWNQCLGIINEDYQRWKDNLELPKILINMKYLTRIFNALRIEYGWLREVSVIAIQQTLMNLDKAFKDFFQGRKGHPKFKKKHHVGGFKIVNHSAIRIKDDKLYLPKSQTGLKLYPHPYFPYRVTSYTATKNRANQYHVCFVTEEAKLTNTQTGIVGIDLGIKDLAIVKPYKGEAFKIPNPRHYVKSQTKRTRLQRRLAKKVKGSKNREKARLKLAKHELKIANIRKDYLHKESTKLIRENQTIILEDLNVKGMMKNHKLAKHIQDCGWTMFKQMLEYKALKYINPVKIGYVDRWFVSSHICNYCNSKLERKLSLNERHWECPICRVVHDRDINAPSNILKQGLINQ